PETWDIFCNVIDNYGDIGVSWRLARQLANEYGLKVRLWVDDLPSFCRLCHAGRMVEIQHCKGVEVRRWTQDFPEVEPGSVVIESFGCALPEAYVRKMAQMAEKPVWINLEYLSAEGWVKDCHLLPSPRPPLVKYFFFPGFFPDTGGLLLEKGLFERRDAFDKRNFWRKLGIDPEGALAVSLFCYENSALERLLQTWVMGVEKVLCLVPEGKTVHGVKAFFGSDGDSFSRGNLEARVIPFVEQEEYDYLLWACDINFVRGEDSFVRAQWAGKPFVWQIYPQDEEAHLKKLEAFVSLYCRDLPGPAAEALHRLWRGWNGGMEDGWGGFLNFRSVLDVHAGAWAEKLSGNNLAFNLLDFCRGKG
ncbi:MAG: elongation factor P maturation arginine rhamnosyltransferase EarP, partial [Burkholderiales bacterium]|nr:elongation factor P maturation arginine rhamnosyltransferase EarP [Burkholderiales bacterium]